ncbi:large conductance mechanosensitive channel protein MscL [Lentibacillus sp. N15]|uniref:large conductance mechanosensitive channel protein MscL n=1 Tax=Lentibacillus songyuanensis TaxID=3136161 RepID=UPI0031BA26C5
MWSDFKSFAMKGNVLELAIAVVIGGAFGKIVTSLVENMIMPLVGVLYSGIDFTHLKYTVGDSEILYGQFIQSVFDFAVISWSIFLVVQVLAKLKHQKEEVKEKTPKRDKKEELLSEIRDLLKQDGKKKKVNIHIGTRDEERRK